MAIRIDTTKNKLAERYGATATHVGLTTGVPATDADWTNPPNNEPSTGGYARQAIGWNSNAVAGVLDVAAGATIPVPAATFNHVIVCTSVSGATMFDWCTITPVIMSTAGSIVVTPKYTQS